MISALRGREKCTGQLNTLAKASRTPISTRAGLPRPSQAACAVGHGFREGGTWRLTERIVLLIDDVLPHQPIRQWVLSFPFQLRYLFANRPAIMGQVLAVQLLLTGGKSCQILSKWVL